MCRFKAKLSPKARSEASRLPLGSLLYQDTLPPGLPTRRSSQDPGQPFDFDDDDGNGDDDADSYDDGGGSDDDDGLMLMLTMMMRRLGCPGA